MVECTDKINSEKTNVRGLLLRRATLDDAQTIVELFQVSYHLGNYPYPERFDINYLSQEIKNGEAKIFLAEYEGVIRGHITLVPKDLKWEIGRFVIHPDFRKRNIGSNVFGYLMNYVKQAEIHNLFIESITSHAGTMKISSLYGMKIIGYEFGIYGNHFDKHGHRETECVLITQSFPSNQGTVFIPKRYQDFANNVYKSFNCVREMKDSTNNSVCEDRESLINEITHIPSCSSEIIIQVLGQDIKKKLEKIIQKLLLKNIKFIKILINVSNASAVGLIEDLADFGFYPCFLWPNFQGKDNQLYDVLAMQYTSASNNFDVNDIQIIDKNSAKILQSIKEHMVIS